MGEEGKGNPCSYAGGLEEKRRMLECAAQAAWPENDRLERRRGSAWKPVGRRWTARKLSLHFTLLLEMNLRNCGSLGNGARAQVPALQGETETKVRDVTRQTLGWRWGLDATDNQGLSLDDRLFWLVSLADGCPPITARQEAMTVDPACPHTGAITPVKVTKPFWGVTRPFLRIISLWRNLTDDDESKSKWINELLRK